MLNSGPVARDAYSQPSDTCREIKPDDVKHNDVILVCFPSSSGKKKISVIIFGSSHEFVVDVI
jgi:hypothetical protein